jgi:hypothetical protein
MRGLFSKAGHPTTGCPSSGNQTAEGVRRRPSESATSTGNPLSITPASEWVVPRSIPAIMASGETATGAPNQRGGGGVPASRKVMRPFVRS